MKNFHPTQRKNARGFSLVEAALSVGILSFGFLSVAPLIGLGVNSACQARTNRGAAQIAETLAEEAQQGTLVAGTGYFDSAENSCPTAAGASYRTEATLATVAATSTSGSVTRLMVQVTPLATPTRSQFYGLVLAPQ